ncbi:hypothetical protein PFICI_10729 [Pestalotiopsis fici W106-1]|uniref:Uncharacterized protein n=1 Tax=Pestalotiopsis fici (strain W106-1 / CGMCC3.15140) TaxID=1229662 RepID=W3WSL8_PESFW|nr:uncharacterized protein PFICI_10729 [Pestalotiopsis fici W106-1]ETS76855.1 hypothetical protein PFICI_10729 [Pestalotiopsis fici W106-1]
MRLLRVVRAGALLLPLVAAHMRLLKPRRFGSIELGATSVKPDPLTIARFPCGKPEGMDATQFYDWSNPTLIAADEPQTMSFQCSPDQGCAIHGGGSCQVSITSDTQPTASSKFFVIQSFEGGCPSLDGTPYSDTLDPLSYPDNYAYAIPSSFPPGNYSLAWSWVPKYSALPEFYMNCAPITLEAKSGKREVSSRDGGQPKLPEMYIVNLAGKTDCQNEPGHNLLYPDPGTNIARDGSDGDGCDRNVFQYASGNGCQVPDAASQYNWCSAATGQLNPAMVHTSPYSHPTGGADTPVDAISVGATAQRSGGSSQSAMGSTSRAITDPSTQQFRTSTRSSPPSSAATSQAAVPTGAASNLPMEGGCQQEGRWNCIDGKSFQRCASGLWSVPQDLVGQKCVVGQGDAPVFLAD